MNKITQKLMDALRFTWKERGIFLHYQVFLLAICSSATFYHMHFIRTVFECLLRIYLLGDHTSLMLRKDAQWTASHTIFAIFFSHHPCLQEKDVPIVLSTSVKLWQTSMVLTLPKGSIWEVIFKHCGDQLPLIGHGILVTIVITKYLFDSCSPLGCPRIFSPSK